MKRLAATLAILGAVVIAAVAVTSAQSPGLIIRGRVISAESGDPLPHARVMVYNDATPLSPIYADAQGRFASPPLAESRYHLVVTKAGYARTDIAGPGVVSPAGVEVQMPRSAAIAGRVLDPFGEPAIGIAVSVVAAPPAGSATVPAPTKTVSTDDLGEYRVGGLPAGNYLVEVNSLSLDTINGEVTRMVSYYPGVAAAGEAQRLTLQPGDQRTGIEFFGVTSQVGGFAMAAQLITGPNIRIFAGNPAGTPLQQPNVAGGTGVIRGRVTRSDGLPLAHVTVTTLVSQAAGGRQGNRQQSVTTDDDGRYEFVELPKGDYRIQAAKAGFTGTAYGQKTATDRPDNVALADNQTRTRIDITLPRYSALAGQVLDDYGDPIEGVTVTVSQIRFQAGRRRLAGVANAPAQTTDDLGRYRIFGLQPGQYVITASVGQVTDLPAGADVSGFAPTYFPGTTNVGEARLVAVQRSQDVLGVDLSLVPLQTARVSGQKVGSDGEPLGGSLILMPSQRSGAIVTPSTGARIEQDGRFEFPNVPPGEYVIQADRGRSQSAAEGEFISEFITVNGKDVGNLLLQATPGSTISGRIVFDGDGTPPPVRTLALIPARADLDRTPLSGGSIARANVRDDLTFELSGIHGPRRLILDRSTSGWVLKSVIANGIDVTDAPLPFGTAEQSLSDVQVLVTNRVTELSGSVTDPRGRAVTDYSLLVFPSDRDQWYPESRFFRRVSSASADTFTVRGLPPADYFVAPVAGLVAQGNDDTWQDPEYLEAIALRATRATLTEGQKLSISARLITP